jgi:hypothetical protein
MRYGKSGLKFLQRTGVMLTYSGPHPKLAPRTLSVHYPDKIVLVKPYPQPQLQLHLGAGAFAPGGDQTQPWPEY